MKTQDPTSTWLTGRAEHEGLPLLLRVRLTAEAHASALGRLVVIRHLLKEVSADGLPDAAYNDSLAVFDSELITAVEANDAGVVVIVETFGGRRTYYAYVEDADRARERIQRVVHAHPQHELEIDDRNDAEWRLYRSYRKDFGW